MANATKSLKDLANAQIKAKKELVNMLTVKDLIGFFTAQMKQAKAGWNEVPTQKQITAYAKECRAQFKVAVAACTTSQDFAKLSAALLDRLHPKAADYRYALA